jgi:hypothetical protein
MLLPEHFGIGGIDVLHVRIDIELTGAQVGQGLRRILEDKIRTPSMQG